MVSLKQDEAMEQVHIGIDQMAQVVQQNNATAEQSAAASQEIGGQAALLQQYASRFRLKAAGMADRNQPA